jgi:hypothetical protein
MGRAERRFRCNVLLYAAQVRRWIDQGRGRFFERSAIRSLREFCLHCLKSLVISHL